MPVPPAAARALFCLLLAVILGACSDLGSPVSIGDRPLSERIEARNQSSTTVAVDDSEEELAQTPESLAFSEAIESGNFIRLNVETNGVNTPLRAGPGAAYQELTSLPDGVEVIASGDQTGEWVYVVCTAAWTAG